MLRGKEYVVFSNNNASFTFNDIFNQWDFSLNLSYQVFLKLESKVYA